MNEELNKIPEKNTSKYNKEIWRQLSDLKPEDMIKKLAELGEDTNRNIEFPLPPGSCMTC